MQDIHAALGQLLQAYTAAVRARDVEAFMALYDDHAQVFDTWGVWSYEGADARRGSISQWFASLGTEYVVVSFDDVRIQGGPELALLSACTRFAGHSAEGQELRSMQNRLTWAVRHSDGGWQIVHEHTSVPINGSDTTAIFQRA